MNVWEILNKYTEAEQEKIIKVIYLKASAGTEKAPTTNEEFKMLCDKILAIKGI